MASFLSKIFPNAALSGYQKKVALINSLESEIQKLSNEEILGESRKLGEEARNSGDLNEILPRAFALVRETGKRVLNQRHFDVQLIGGMALHDGKIAEMMTGEGKTLAATLPAYLNGLTGLGAHVVTVNDYLAKRDAVWMGQIYHALGLTVSCLLHDAAYRYDPTFEADPEADKERDMFGNFKVIEKFLRPITRKEAYACDITYGTNHEFGFDFLRDNLSNRTEDCVQREYNFVIIDEVDSILIDEARTPLIIAAPDTQASEFYKTFAKVAEKLEPEIDYMTDEKMKAVNITESGIDKMEKMTGIQNIYAPENLRLVHFLQESLKAKGLFKLDRDYIVQNGEVVIVDEFTGRMLFGRRYSGGLHQAIEAKEGVPVKDENRTYAQVTIQNYFRLYKKIAGMTGTAQTSAEEFHKVYNLDVMSIPSNRPMIREDMADMIYKTKDGKYKAAVEDIKVQRAKGRPILVGTTSIVNNEIISEYLRKAGIPHEVLNAKNHEREGAIIAQAGRAGSVTVATNMAGRGVDIVLGGNPSTPEEAQKVKDAGGLYVMGTERHEARRIDNQLRGRSGRQGDPGSTQFFLSLEDDLLRIFGGDRIKSLMETLKYPEDMPIQSGVVAKVVNQAQAKVEGANFDIRKHLLDFDDVLNKQRTAIYGRRRKILEAGEKNEILPILKETLEHFVSDYKTGLESEIQMNPEKREELEKQVSHLDEHLAKIPETLESERAVIIGRHLTRIMDTLWIDHLENLEQLRESVNIRAYGQHEPLVEYRREAHMLYKQFQNAFESLTFNTIFAILQLDLNNIQSQLEQSQRQAPPPPEHKDIGRNDLCWCGSNKKYKKCHGR